MITFFTIPKPFRGRTGIQQRNALRSWRAIPDCEIILFGNEYGTEEIAKEFGARHLPNIPLSEYGTPYLNEVFTLARMSAKHDYLCYVNTDIILYEDIIESIVHIPFKEFLMTGQRWDVDVDTPVFPNDTELIRKEIRSSTLQKFPGMDYFLFPKNMVINLPPFIVGRRGWDNWLVYNIRARGIPVIDGTGYVRAIHQNHTYEHIPETLGERWEKCPESDYNLSLVKNRIIYLWELGDATHQFRNGELVKKQTLRQITQGLILKTPHILHPVIEPFYRAGHMIKCGLMRVMV